MEKEFQQMPDFFPQGSCSRDEIKEAVLNHLEATLDLIPGLPIGELNLKNLEQIDSGTYTLNERPPLAFIKELPKFKGGKAEVGLFCIQGKWLIFIGEKLEINLPVILASVNSEGIFQLDMHSHPATHPSAEQPSGYDIPELESTIDGYNYLIGEKGLIEFHLPAKLPGGYSKIYDHSKAWEYWILEELKLFEDEFNERGGRKLKRQFYENFFGLRIIPWENEEEIKRVLVKENLKK